MGWLLIEDDTIWEGAVQSKLKSVQAQLIENRTRSVVIQDYYVINI